MPWPFDTSFWAWIQEPHLWWWSQDSVVWDWIRTAIAALTGALLGGLFTLAGQSRQAKASRDMQSAQLAAQKVADDTRWERERANTAREKSLEAAEDLYGLLIEQAQRIRAARLPKITMTAGGEWAEWDTIWDSERSLEFQNLTRKLPEQRTRSAINRVIHMLDQSGYLTAEWNPTRIVASQHDLVTQLVGEGIEIIGSFLRDDDLSDEHESLLNSLESAWKRYLEYEDWSIQRSIELAESAALEEEHAVAPANDPMSPVRPETSAPHASKRTNDD